MARKKIRECTAKTLLKRHHKLIPSTFTPVQAHAGTDWAALRAENPWILTAKLVVKPDMLFGQRGKHDLVALNVTIDEAEKFVKERLGRVISVGHPPVTDAVTHFIIERFVPHKEEYYLSINSMRQSTQFYVSAKGGVEVEENWDSMKSFEVEVGDAIDDALKTTVLEGFAEEHKDAFWAFVVECFRVFEDLDFTMMEFNPICVVPNEATGGSPVVIPLDMRGELDDQAAFKNQRKWGAEVETFPQVFGHQPNPEEEYVAQLDAQTGASLKLTILNPKGRVWLLVAGGGASVIYTDTVCDLGYSDTLGNYGEYSGNPTDEHTYEYAKTVLKAATKSAAEGGGPDGRALIIGGGIANFTDVKATFRGICRALLEASEAIKARKMKIFVRRGGPNFEAALQMMKDIEAGVGVPVDVFGPETHMTKIVHMATDYIKFYDGTTK